MTVRPEAERGRTERTISKRRRPRDKRVFMMAPRKRSSDCCSRYVAVSQYEKIPGEVILAELHKIISLKKAHGYNL
jgi:hypothetical protein